MYIGLGSNLFKRMKNWFITPLFVLPQYAQNTLNNIKNTNESTLESLTMGQVMMGDVQQVQIPIPIVFKMDILIWMRVF